MKRFFSFYCSIEKAYWGIRHNTSVLLHCELVCSLLIYSSNHFNLHQIYYKNCFTDNANTDVTMKRRADELQFGARTPQRIITTQHSSTRAYKIVKLIEN